MGSNPKSQPASGPGTLPRGLSDTQLSPASLPSLSRPGPYPGRVNRIGGLKSLLQISEEGDFHVSWFSTTKWSKSHHPRAVKLSLSFLERTDHPVSPSIPPLEAKETTAQTVMMKRDPNGPASVHWFPHP